MQVHTLARALGHCSHLNANVRIQERLEQGMHTRRRPQERGQEFMSMLYA